VIEVKEIVKGNRIDRDYRAVPGYQARAWGGNDAD